MCIFIKKNDLYNKFIISSSLLLHFLCVTLQLDWRQNSRFVFASEMN